jgi:hypothetical protein
MRVMNIIFAAVSEILGMGPEWLPNICKSGDCMQRGLYYPGARNLPNLARQRAAVLKGQWKVDNLEITPEMQHVLNTLEEGVVPQGTMRSHRHTDIDVGTILPRASAKGLFAIARSGEHVAISGDDNEVMYQNGDTTEDFSGGYLLSAQHYVKNPLEMPEEDRINAVLFGHADRGTWVDIVPTMRRCATKSVTPATERRKLILRLQNARHSSASRTTNPRRRKARGFRFMHSSLEFRNFLIEVFDDTHRRNGGLRRGRVGKFLWRMWRHDGAQRYSRRTLSDLACGRILSRYR